MRLFIVSVEDASPSTSWSDIGPPHPYMDVTYMLHTCPQIGRVGGGAPGLFTSA